jgi:hypothetical protein
MTTRRVTALFALLVGGAIRAPVQRPDGWEREMALALSAGPAAIREAAAVYVLGVEGYVRAREGTNAFSCLVERDDPRTTEPICYDAEGSATLLQVALWKAGARARGLADSLIRAEVDARFQRGEFRAPSRPGIAYMLFSNRTVVDPASGRVIRYIPHVMFYMPHRRASELGLRADQAEPGMPFMIFEGRPEGYVIVPLVGS